ncbi:hypothetical protein [Nocardiopsis eucommiae]|uniref:hypothetical protein n=1 Tax=Nocardiopsis eucommiae TaxID=2831970 RepID=UPI003D75E6D7
MSPEIARWDREVIREPDGTVFVCCVGEGGHPIALELGPECPEALGLLLIDPDGA